MKIIGSIATVFKVEVNNTLETIKELKKMMFGRNPGSDKTWQRIKENSIGVELGVWKGESSEKFLRRTKHLHLVDPWSPVAYEDSDEFGDYQGYLERYSKLVGSSDPEDFQHYYDSVANEVKEKFKDNSVTIHRMTSDQFFEIFNEKVDWVYVDALHSFDGCLSDLRNSLKIIRSGGFIYGDDYNGSKPGVTAAFNAFADETGLALNNFYMDQVEIEIK